MDKQATAEDLPTFKDIFGQSAIDDLIVRYGLFEALKILSGTPLPAKAFGDKGVKYKSQPPAPAHDAFWGDLQIPAPPAPMAKERPDLDPFWAQAGLEVRR